jgi:hypothetical protein
MRQLKRFAVACILAASLSAVAVAGEMDCPLTQTDTSPGEVNAPPGETQGPGFVDPVTVEGVLVALFV